MSSRNRIHFAQISITQLPTQITTSPDRQLYGNVNYSAQSGQDGVIVAGVALWHAPGGRL